MEAAALVGGKLATDLLEVTSDPAVLDSGGIWVVVVPYDGDPVFARFGSWGPVTRDFGSWRGPNVEAWQSSVTQDEYVAAVQSVREQIAAGEVYQVNVCRVMRAPLPEGADILSLATHLASAHPAPYAAAVRIPGAQIACASPELFLRRDGARLVTGPIKGTAKSADAFLEKDTAENIMIVDLMRNDIAQVARTGSVVVDELLRVEEHPGLVHLVSDVSCELRDSATWPEIFDATFPPGSVTGAPKLAATRIIGELERASRGPYCGAIGIVDADRDWAELAVAIRTFWIADGYLHFGTGAGITWSSDPLAEWSETELKAERLVALASERGGI